MKRLITGSISVLALGAFLLYQPVSGIAGGLTGNTLSQPSPTDSPSPIADPASEQTQSAPAPINAAPAPENSTSHAVGQKSVGRGESLRSSDDEEGDDEYNDDEHGDDEGDDDGEYEGHDD